MTEQRCRRCEWRSVHNVDTEQGRLSGNAQLALHAIESAHPLCIVCYRSLGGSEKQVCERCITDAQTNLSGIRSMYDWLPHHLRIVASTALDRSHGGDDGRPLPGGDALALLGHGSEGLEEDGETSRDGDPVSVAFELHWWEKDWRETRREPHDDNRARSSSRVFHDAAGYLERHTRWAATSHLGFDGYARDLADLHRRLHVATGQHRHPTQLNGECPKCRGRLFRAIDAGGLEEDDASCRDCGATYGTKEFDDLLKKFYATSSHFIDGDGIEWARLEVLVGMLDRKVNTIKRWAVLGWIERARHGTPPVTFFHVGQAKELDATRPRRSRAS